MEPVRQQRGVRVALGGVGRTDLDPWMLIFDLPLFCYFLRTCVAVSGEDYCVVAADTRMSTGFSIMTRDATKICEL